MQITMDKKMLLYETIQRALEDKHRRISYVDAEALFDSLLSVIKGHLLQGHKIFLCHIGTLSTKDMQERTVRDPITHQLHTVPARRHVCWHTSKRLKRELQEPQQNS